MTKRIAIIASLDTKGEEAEFLRQEIQSSGYDAALVDIGMKGEPRVAADISRKDIIEASGEDAAKVEGTGDREKVMNMVIKGAGTRLKELLARSELEGVIGIGGITGTRMGTSIMKMLPFGLPKVAVSSTASLQGFATRYIGAQDIALIHSVVEFGQNDMLKNVLARGARAVCAMAEANKRYPIPRQGERNLVAMTTWGPSEKCGTCIREGLEAKGYQVVSFPSNGTGDRAMEDILERQGVFQAVIELAPGGIGEELLGFTRAAGPYRLEAAGKRGITQIITLSGVNYGSPLKKKYKPDYETRKKYAYDGLRTFVRLSHDELRLVAGEMARKLNQAKGKIWVVIPLGGWSSIDAKGTDFCDKEADAIFVEELKKRLNQTIGVKEIDVDLDTEDFGRAIIDLF
jgi:uncharacterized protein (UPF0261 family)